MSDHEKARAFAPIADRLGKLVPRLGSNHHGEVLATVEAIGRTLAGAGLDFHDLAERIARPAFGAVEWPTARPQPAWSQPAPPTPPKPRPEPSPWPTWATLSHFGRIGQLDAIKAAGCIPAEHAEAFAAFRANYLRHQIPPGRKTIGLFNAACRRLWEMGARSGEAA